MKWIKKQIRELAKRHILILLGEVENMLHEMAITPKSAYRYASLELGVSVTELKISIWEAIAGIDLENE